jgi:hypothetical protein
VLIVGTLAPAQATIDKSNSAGTSTVSAGFNQPYSWRAYTKPGAPKDAEGWDPINAVIVLKDTALSAAENEKDILAALNKEKHVSWTSVGIGVNIAAGNCISPEKAAVQPGDPKQTVQDFSWRTVTCHNPALGIPSDVTNHLRGYIQQGTGAWFLAVSKEHACFIGKGIQFRYWHCITKNGYNEGRDELVSELKGLPGYAVTISDAKEYDAGQVPQHPKGYHTPYDGQVAIITLTRKTPLVALPYQAKGWQYKQVAYGDIPNFYKVRFNASHWPHGQAGFGTTGGFCPWNNTTDVHTPWSVDTDMLTRHELIIPAGATDVHIAGTIDNDATVYLNGHQLQYVQSGNCQAGAIDVTAPKKDLKKKSLLAIRGHDDGVETYLDVTVTYKP